MTTEICSVIRHRSGTRLTTLTICATTCMSELLLSRPDMLFEAAIKRFLFSTVLLSVFAFTLMGQPPSCSPLQASEKKNLADYVHNKYRLSNSVSVNVVHDELVPNTCFHEVKFEGKSTLKTWELRLYLSPDRRFLSSDLLDTRLDPVQEEQQKAQALMSGLAENKDASKGPTDAAVTIVEFSDFECPYCRTFAEILNQVLLTEKDQVRVVFHHFPLSSHPWARIAAEGAACAQLQNSRAFWLLHDWLFQEQTKISPENIKDKLIEFASATKEVISRHSKTA